MPTIRMTVSGKTVVAPSTYIVADNADYIAHVQFDDTWPNGSVKTMRINYAGTTHDVVFTGTEVALPKLHYQDVLADIGFYSDGQQTTRPAKIMVLPSILTPEGTPAAPEDDVYQQLIALVNASKLSGAEINAEGHLIITTADGAEYDAGYAVGPEGPAGGGAVISVNGVFPDKNGNVEITIPDSGANVDQVEPADDDIPKVFFGSALQQTKDEVVTTFRYISKTQDISGYAEIKAQGNSSMGYPKKNQTVKLYKDAECTEKLKVDFKGWGEQRKFCFKANWIDLTHSRNVVSARLWGDIVKSRANYAELPELYRTSPNQGAVDGFPIKVYAAGIYQGRYTLNIPKDAWMANMDDELDEHCILCGEGYTSGCFRSASMDEWTDEVHDSCPTAISTRWLEIINFVMNSTDEEFKAGLSNYFYADSLIDYHLFHLANCGLDAYGKNQLYMTYDAQKWIAQSYDMDSTWGLYWNGSSILASDYARESYEDMLRDGNLLFIRLEECFWEELQTRWVELKNGALSITNIINRFERFTDITPAELVKEDYATTTGSGAFTAIPSKTTNTIQQIRTFALERQAWTDEYVAALTPKVEVPCESIALDVDTLTFTESGSQTLTATVTPDGCTDEITWKSDDESIATVDDGVVTAVSNGSATITAKCGDYSAVCAVEVSGIAVRVPCTSITLSVSELTFDGVGKQTIVATVEPADTTDKIVWSSDYESIATVDGGVVTAVSNGSATITATCGEQSANCPVTVSGISLVYSLPTETVLDGTSNIDTGVMLFDTDKDFTVLIDFLSAGTNSTTAILLGAEANASPWPGFQLNVGKLTSYGLSEDSPTRSRLAVVHTAGATKLGIYAADGDSFYKTDYTINKGSHELTLKIGSHANSIHNFWDGTVYSCEVHLDAFTDDETFAWIGAQSKTLDVVWSDTASYKINSGNVATGSNYVTPDAIELPDGASMIVLSNIDTASYTYLGLAIYDENMALISYNEESSGDFSTRLSSDAKYIRCSAYPAGVATNNNPANQIAVTLYIIGV